MSNLKSNSIKAHGVIFVKYASILLQSLTIMIDEDFLMEIIDMTRLKGVWESMEEECVSQFSLLDSTELVL
jgi:vacuolar protein sorting-associated protein 13A/C